MAREGDDVEQWMLEMEEAIESEKVIKVRVRVRARARVRVWVRVTVTVRLTLPVMSAVS